MFDYKPPCELLAYFQEDLRAHLYLEFPHYHPQLPEETMAKISTRINQLVHSIAVHTLSCEDCIAAKARFNRALAGYEGMTDKDAAARFTA